MAKGGKRVPSDIMPVGKGMGLEQHYETLKTISRLQNTSISLLMTELNKKHAWWDDPNNRAPRETCRSYVKELWRLGLVDRFANDELIELNQENWSLAKHDVVITISKRGKFVLKQKPRQFPYYVAWCILHAMRDGMYPQCKKLFQLYDINKKIPVNDVDTAQITDENKIYVETHAGKAIKFGWLEPTGLIYRANRKYFKINETFKQQIEDDELENIFRGVEIQVDDDDLEVVSCKPYLGYHSFSRDSELKFEFEFKNKTKKSIDITLDPILSAVFEHVACLQISHRKFELLPNETKDVEVILRSAFFGFSDSFGRIFCGFLNIITKKKIRKIYFPTISIAKKDRVWENKILCEFKELGLQTFHFGKSDRPDGVIDLSGLNGPPDDLLAYLRDSTKEKMLMETTVGTYTWAKRREDTQKTSIRDAKYKRHALKVLKIEAVGQIIAAEKFDKDIVVIEDEKDHIITLIDCETLKYLKSKKKESGNGKNTIIKILKLDKKIEKTDINKIFEELE